MRRVVRALAGVSHDTDALCNVYTLVTIASRSLARFLLLRRCTRASAAKHTSVRRCLARLSREKCTGSSEFSLLSCVVCDQRCLTTQRCSVLSARRQQPGDTQPAKVLPCGVQDQYAWKGKRPMSVFSPRLCNLCDFSIATGTYDAARVQTKCVHNTWHAQQTASLTSPPRRQYRRQLESLST